MVKAAGAWPLFYLVARQADAPQTTGTQCAMVSHNRTLPVRYSCFIFGNPFRKYLSNFYRLSLCWKKYSPLYEYPPRKNLKYISIATLTYLLQKNLWHTSKLFDTLLCMKILLEKILKHISILYSAQGVRNWSQIIFYLTRSTIFNHSGRKRFMTSPAYMTHLPTLFSIFFKREKNWKMGLTADHHMATRATPATNQVYRGVQWDPIDIW